VSEANQPVPAWCELLNEGSRECAVTAPAWPDVHGARGELQRALLGIFQEFEATLLRTIESQDDSFTEFSRFVLMSELDPPPQILEIRVDRLLDTFPGCF